jgi:hypothetical protein
VVSSPIRSPSPAKRRLTHDAARHDELISQVVGTGTHHIDARPPTFEWLLFPKPSRLGCQHSLS